MNTVSKRSPELLRGPFIICLLAALIAGLGSGCRPALEGDGNVPQRDINTVLGDNADRLMALDGVVMVAVGKLNDGTACIQVYVNDRSELLTREIGSQIEGYPVDYILSDEIRPLQ